MKFAGDDLDAPAPARHGRLRLVVGAAALALVAIIVVTVSSGKRTARSGYAQRADALAAEAAVLTKIDSQPAGAQISDAGSPRTR
jgi:hypothetical protein